MLVFATTPSNYNEIAIHHLKLSGIVWRRARTVTKQTQSMMVSNNFHLHSSSIGPFLQRVFKGHQEA
jgi:hypothetical protein